MASATGIPANMVPQSTDNEPEPGYAETAPLLGRAGDASQKDGAPLWYNLILGTAPLAQAGALLLTLHVWTTILLASPRPAALFLAHPLPNITAVLVLTQSVLLLQPTHTTEQKRTGARLHGVLNAAAFALFLVGLCAIQTNKFSHAGAHFKSAHAVLGVVTYAFIGAQAAVGASMYWTPGLYGGEQSAKRVWKYHRASGYLLLLLVMATVLAACWTDYNVSLLDVKVWAVVICEVLMLLGLGARVRASKFF